MSPRAVVNHRLMVPNLALQDCPRAPPEFRGGDGDVWTKKVNNQITVLVCHVTGPWDRTYFPC